MSPRGASRRRAPLGHAGEEGVTVPTGAVTTDDRVNGERVAGWGLGLCVDQDTKEQVAVEGQHAVDKVFISL